MKVQLSYDLPSKVKTDLLVVILDENIRLHDLGGSPLEETVDQIRKDFKSRRLHRESLTTLAQGNASHLVVFSTSLDPAYNIWENLKTYVAKSVRLGRELGLRRVSVALNTEEALPFIGKAEEGALLGSYVFSSYKKEHQEREKFFKKMRVDLIGLKSHGSRSKFYLKRYRVVSDAVNLARDLINEPGSVATPVMLAEQARAIASESKLGVRIWDEKQLKKSGFNGLIQVGKGSAHKPRMIRLSYRAKNSRHHLALVGKGITFDTGGISIKPAANMFEMKGDMSGGAAVLAAMKAIGQLKPSVSVTGIVVAAENTPDAEAQRPGDILTARNGKTIMVDNTDAEGRLVLTDGLFQAGEEGATHVVDIATLTGSCVRALGDSIAGIMGNTPDLTRAIIESGQNHGEVFWELPLPAEYKDLLKTPYADLNNIGGALAGASTAGLFLQEFIPKDVAWAHLDIAGPFMRSSRWKYYEAGAIGFGAKTMIDLAERFNDYFE